jgi:chromosome segregation ATPase
MSKSNVVTRKYHEQVVENLRAEIRDCATLGTRVVELEREVVQLQEALDSEKKRHEYTKANLSGAQTLLGEANNAVGRFRRAMAAIGKVAEIAF